MSRSRRVPARGGRTGAVPVVAVVVLLVSGVAAFAAFTDSETNLQEVTAATAFPGTGAQVKAQSMSPAPDEREQVTLGLQVENTGDAALDLTTVTLRYWFTNDYGSGGLDSRCNYVPAPLDCSKVRRAVGTVEPARVGGDRYLELAFTSGTLPAGGSTGGIQVQVFRSGGSGPFDQTDDFSHTTRSSLGDAPNVTLYVDGNLAWGTEPEPRPLAPGLRVRYTDLDGDPTNSSMAPGLIVENTGASEVRLRDVELRYWFSHEGDEAFDTWCDYAVLGCGIITHRVDPAQADGTDRVMVVGFSDAVLPVGSSTGDLRLRANTRNYGMLDESDDYSHGSTGPFVEWAKVTAYVDGELAWGVPP